MRKRYSANDKAQIVLEALKEEKSIAQIAALALAGLKFLQTEGMPQTRLIRIPA